jgi:hypothetical protein
MSTQNLLTTADLLASHTVRPQYAAGQVIGIIAVDLIYPKLPGNVANASTYDFPVAFRAVKFEIEQLFAGDPSIKEMIVQAARELEAEGVRAIVGACGYFAHFQQDVAAAVDIPVFMSSLLQLPMIKAGLKPNQNVLVLAADGESIKAPLLEKVGAAHVPIVVQNVGSMPSFAPIRWGKLEIDNKALTEDLANLAADIVAKHNAEGSGLPEIGAVLLECSDLPPYAWAIQNATGLPVFDFQTLIKWVKGAVVQVPYYGLM